MLLHKVYSAFTPKRIGIKFNEELKVENKNLLVQLETC